MWEFDNLPENKIAELKKLLSGVKISKPVDKYTEMPITERLEIMEKVYTVLGKDDEWWETFYRVKGYHYGKAGNHAKAFESRSKSLSLINKEIKNAKKEVPPKLLYYISGAMKHFLDDDKGSLEDFQKALGSKYVSKDENPEQQNSAEKGINQRIQDYITRIKSETVKPRLFDKYSEDEH